MKVLVTGGLGYIGSHTVVELIAQGHDVVIVDNLYNAREEVKNRLEKITGKKIPVTIADCTDRDAMKALFDAESFDCVIHFAGYKAVGESVGKPLAYYENNLLSAIVILEQMVEHGVPTFVFSSSATVYAPTNEAPFREGLPLGATNPYGWTKVMIEQMLSDLAKAQPEMNLIALRYFNPIGAHESGLLGERPVGVPNNLMPYICQVADGTREKLHVFGQDYDTVDGTGVRDYIHVTDLARGHVAALEEMNGKPGYHFFNLGTGRGTSVLELVHAFEKANDLEIPYVVDDRRPGDVAEVYADVSLAEKELHWNAALSIEQACASSWNFQKRLKEEA